MENQQQAQQGQGMDDLIYRLESSMVGEELTQESLARLAAIQCLHASVLDAVKYIIAVDNFEATMDAMLDAEYRQAVSSREADIHKEGSAYQKAGGQIELARWKFRQLMRLIDRNKAHDEVLKT